MKNNMLIAEFMGLIDSTGIRIPSSPYVCGQNINEESLEYNSSWDWLFPVFHEIRGIVYSHENFRLYFTGKNYLQWFDGDLHISGDLKDVYKEVINFINFFNKI